MGVVECQSLDYALKYKAMLLEEDACSQFPQILTFCWFPFLLWFSIMRTVTWILLKEISFCGGYKQHYAGDLCVFKKKKN